METLTCPKCRNAMRTYERSGVTVDQCTECGGIFLDRGELGRLSAAEAAWGQQPPADPRQHEQQRYEQQPRYEQQRYEQPHHEHGYQQQHHKPRKKKESFFDDLFG